MISLLLALAMVSNNAFGLPVSINTLVIIVMIVAIIAVGAVWFFTKMGEGFFE
jgi:hypothetical protein